MLTIFSTCKPAKKGRDHIIHNNAIGSWRQLTDDVILFGDEGHEEHIEALAERHGCRLFGDIERNQWGTPLMRSLFAKAQEHGKYDWLCYANTDIIFLDDLIDTVQKVAGQQSPPWVLVGRKWALDCVPPPIDFASDWQAWLHKLPGKLWYPTGTDYMIFCKGLNTGDWLPFAVGRWRWDTAAMGHLVHEGIAVIDATEAIWAVHQYHPQPDRDTPEERHLAEMYKGCWRKRIRHLTSYLTKEGEIHGRRGLEGSAKTGWRSTGSL